MKNLLALFCFLLSLSSVAQLCPGGGVDFSSAVTFDPSWIYGCNTGTSCNGGVNFSNLIACQPTTALDACAPAPSCGNITQNGSNIWFKFYPLGPTVTISCFQNSSLVLGIQAFSGGPACGSLTEIGCSLAGGPSSGVQLALTGLMPGQLYYFRIFGSAKPVSQRTGNYCFCGTTGLNNVVLPVTLESFRGFIAGDKVDLEWTTAPAANYQYFEVQKSTDGSSYADIARVEASADPSYSYLDNPGTTDTLFYRLKLYTDGNDYTYSRVIPITRQANDGLRLYFDGAAKQLQITVQQSTSVAIVSAAGILMKTLVLTPGRNYVSVSGLAAGIYFLHDRRSNTNKRFFVFN
ncbi:MAG TPA: hypothetical protein VGS79_12975 [Puia sp.]|nr:hypothetical protein [Puia sp.]